jgi:tRNA(Ile)-lysidine synthase
MRILRGALFRGMAGIPYSRDLEGSEEIRIVRPLLDCGREALRDLLESRSIPWVEDASNQDPRYTRNRIRAEVLPILQAAVDRAPRESILQIARMAREALHIMEEQAAMLLRQGKDVTDWKYQPPVVIGEALRSLYLDAGGRAGAFSQAMIEGLIEAIREGKSRFHVTWPGKIQVILKEGTLKVGSYPEVPRIVSVLDVPGDSICSWAGTVIRAELSSSTDVRPDPWEERFDWDEIRPPLVVRPWTRQDRVRPFGGPPGEKLVREILMSAKVPRDERADVPVVSDREGILWIVGVRRGSRAPVTAETRMSLRLSTRTSP